MFLNPRRKELHGKLDEFKALINRVIEQKKKSIAEGDKKNDALAENEKDLLTLMIESEQRGEGALTNEELQSNVMVFFLAGHDTTTSALTSALYYLAKYQVGLLLFYVSVYLIRNNAIRIFKQRQERKRSAYWVMNQRMSFPL